jgi:hypothetical protein
MLINLLTEKEVEKAWSRISLSLDSNAPLLLIGLLLSQLNLQTGEMEKFKTLSHTLF